MIDKKLPLVNTGFTVKGLIREARGELTQTEFAVLLGVDQTSISKYEKGVADPPARVIEACIGMKQEREMKDHVSANEIARRIREELGGTEFARLRTALNYVIDSVGRR